MKNIIEVFLKNPAVKKEVREQYPHVLLEYISSSVHLHYVVDDELAVGGQEVPPLVQGLNLPSFVILLSICPKHQRTGRKE